jgi:hypothetical protein
MNAETESDEAPAEVVIDAAFMATILETDLANIVKKASNGQPLNARERAMIEEERTRLQKKSISAFTLEGEGPATALEKMTQRELADEWGYSVRSIKGWIAEGREKSDPCPLTRPEEMPAWFARVHAPRQCPDKLRDAAQRILAGDKAKAPSVAPPPAVLMERIEIAEGEKGMLAMLDRYRTAEATLHRKYMEAVEAGDETRAQFLLSEWSKMGEKLRQVEKSAPAALEALGIYVRRDEIQRELEPLHHAVLKSFKQALRLHRNRLRLTETTDEWNLVSDEIVNEVALMLCESDFTEPLELHAA